MAFWNRKKKKNKIAEEETFLDPELDLEKEFANRRPTKDDAFDRIESMQYVRTQCEQVADSSRYITKLKSEYQVVNQYLGDIQRIDTAVPNTKDLITHLAQEALRLGSKNEKYQKKKANLPRARFEMFERYKEDFPEALTSFQNDEKYLQVVKHDMKILESEKITLKEDIDSYGHRRIVIRNWAWFFFILMVITIAVFAVTTSLNNDIARTVFMVAMFVSVMMVAILVVAMRTSTYRLKLSEKKLARAITLLNKTKIKYVNIVNTVDYQKAKYAIKNAYQFSHEYELYLMDLKAMERYESSAKELDFTLASLNQVLKGLELYDVSVWQSQLEALVNPKEMVEVRHSLNIRRQKLREQIDYNMGRIEEAKKGVIAFMKKHPEDANAIMEIVDSYDVEME